jgi:intracellular septation protein
MALGGWTGELVAVGLFVGVYVVAGVYAAAASAVLLAGGQLAWAAWRRHPLSSLHTLGLGLVVVFGTLTVLFHNDAFIKAKPTLLYWAVAAVLAARVLRGRGGPYLIEQAVPPTREFRISNPRVWRAVDAAWAIFLIALGATNWAVAAHASTDAWVSFKLFGVTSALAAAVLAQSCVLNAYNEYDMAADLAAQRAATVVVAAAATAAAGAATAADDAVGRAVEPSLGHASGAGTLA